MLNSKICEVYLSIKSLVCYNVIHLNSLFVRQDSMLLHGHVSSLNYRQWFKIPKTYQIFQIFKYISKN